MHLSACLCVWGGGGRRSAPAAVSCTRRCLFGPAASDAQVVGCLLVDSKPLRNDLLPITSTTLDRIKQLLLTMARDTCAKVLDDVRSRIALLQARPTVLDEFMAYQVMHGKQVEAKKAVLAAAQQVDDMYDMLAAYDQKVPTKDSVQHDDLRDSTQQFVAELTTGKEFIADHKANQVENLVASVNSVNDEVLTLMSSLHQGGALAAAPGACRIKEPCSGFSAAVMV